MQNITHSIEIKTIYLYFCHLKNEKLLRLFYFGVKINK